ncbi:molybdopterin-dependent oxidoreductase [Streptomyces sp. SID2119]|uniref:molybdopterin-dependent oxidoreductase n=1 Tax=Streptomyces sp. SID2119 TaxID=2690253 RepID=UPI001371FFB6|nr:molybdopterin-dependent oxidoreductase [Streptomyces sp. SID2119]MYW32569.1 molybdopterin-dependent oxidoreductase [Streptomyces sp. SID2119]
MSRLGAPRRATAAQLASLALLGDVGRPATLTVGDLRDGWRQHRAEVVFDCATSGPQRHVFEGPLLREVALTSQPLFDALRRKDRSRFALAVSGGDGHHTVLAWAEIDADFGNAPVLLATRLDGEDLDVAGSQLVVPVDRCGARYISAITRVWVGAWPGTR